MTTLAANRLLDAIETSEALGQLTNEELVKQAGIYIVAHMDQIRDARLFPILFEMLQRVSPGIFEDGLSIPGDPTPVPGCVLETMREVSLMPDWVLVQQCAKSPLADALVVEELMSRLYPGWVDDPRMS